METADLIERRILTTEARSLVIERMNEKAIADLYSWFTAREGGDHGRALLRQLPLLDRTIERSGKRGMTALHRAPRVVAIDQFSCGLLIGAAVQSHVHGCHPFHENMDIGQAIATLHDAGPTIQRLSGVHQSMTDDRERLATTIRVWWHEARDIICATARLAAARGPRCPRNRFQFHVGLLASGIDFHTTTSQHGRRRPTQGLLFARELPPDACTLRNTKPDAPSNQ